MFGASGSSNLLRTPEVMPPGAKNARDHCCFQVLSVDLTYGAFWNPICTSHFCFWLWTTFSSWLWVSCRSSHSCLLFYTGHEEQYGVESLDSVNFCWSIMLVLSGNPFGRNQTVVCVAGQSWRLLRYLLSFSCLLSTRLQVVCLLDLAQGSSVNSVILTSRLWCVSLCSSLPSVLSASVLVSLEALALIKAAGL